MSNVAVIDPQPQRKRSLIDTMSAAYSMDAAAFARTVKATCMPQNSSDEDFAAFLLVAHQHKLNPVTREIYAFPKKGGGVQPIVGIDGWMTLINSHPQFDGMEFDDNLDAKGGIASITCRIFRKDRQRPVTITEYMDECRRPTEPWQKWPARMLRHKAAIQAARYAFGFAGIIDPEEAERSPEVITSNVVAPPPQIGRIEVPTPQVEEGQSIEDGDLFDLEAFLSELDEAMATGRNEDEVITIWDDFDVESTLTSDEAALQRAFDLRADRIVKLSPINAG